MAEAKQSTDKFYIPLEIIKSSAGFALDIGCSMAKIVYRPKDTYKDGNFTGKPDPNCPSGMGPLLSTQFPRDEPDTYMAFLKENCDIKQGATVYCTGAGGSQYQQKIEAVGVKLHMLSEFECFSKSLNIMLKSFIKKDWLHPLNLKGIDDGLELLKLQKLMQDMSAGRPLMTDAEFKSTYLSQVKGYIKRCEEESKHLAGCVYPYLLVMCGSAFAFVLVQEDGSCEMLDFSSISGRFFLGLGSILGKEKDFSQLMKMCHAMDGRSVDIFGRDLLSDNPDEQEDHYSKFPPHVKVFPFGKGHDIELETAKEGDMVSSLLMSICENLSLNVFHICRGYKLRHAYFCGGFVSQELARRYITSGLTSRNLPVPSGTRVICDFVTNSSHLGSIGAFVKTD